MKLKLATEEKTLFNTQIAQMLKEFKEDKAFSKKVFADRCLDTVNNILKSRDTVKATTTRLKPEDQGDIPGFVLVN